MTEAVSIRKDMMPAPKLFCTSCCPSTEVGDKVAMVKEGNKGTLLSHEILFVDYLFVDYLFVDCYIMIFVLNEIYII